MLVLGPGIVAALNKSARVEEGMLRTKFGGAYDALLRVRDVSFFSSELNGPVRGPARTATGRPSVRPPAAGRTLIAPPSNHLSNLTWRGAKAPVQRAARAG